MLEHSRSCDGIDRCGARCVLHSRVREWFQFKEGRLQRVDGLTLIPMELNLSQYRGTLTPPRPEDKMRCVGMVIHTGHSLQHGHYRAITVTGKDNFHLFDDRVVRAMQAIGAYERDDVYFVVYERSTKPPHRQQPLAFPTPAVKNYPTDTASPEDVLRADSPLSDRRPWLQDLVPSQSEQSTPDTTKTIVPLKPTKTYEKPKKTQSSTTAQTPARPSTERTSFSFSRDVLRDVPGWAGIDGSGVEGRWQPLADESLPPQHLSSGSETLGSARPDPRRQPGASSPLAASTPTATAGAGLARRLLRLPPPTTSTPIRAVDETEASSESDTTATKTIVPLKPTKTYGKPKSDSSSTAPRKAPAAPSLSSPSSTSQRVQGRWQIPRVDESLGPQHLSSGGETLVLASPQHVEDPRSASDVVASALRACGGGLSPLATPSPQGPKLPLLLTPSPIKSTDFTDLEPMWTWATRSDPGASALRSTFRPVRTDGALVGPWSDSSEEEPRDRLPAPTSCHEPVPVRHLKCTECWAKFRDKRSLQRHLLRHSLVGLSDRRLYSCCYCASSFRTVDLLHRHLRLHVDDSDLLQCPKKFCSMQCRNLKRLHRHLTAHRLEKRFFNMPQRNPERLTSPNTRTDRNQREETKPKAKQLRHQCRLCKRCFDDCKTLRRHHRTFGERGDQKECRACERRRQRIQNLNDKKERIVPWENHKNFILRTIGLWS
ncbi:uncharacterized protein LOC113204011 isoform X2 [Frankliniella occidentalis]|uniref:Uncharacterized protein LOC113204011 isoform X2 n=1 Tax=Frankliniella occidentalis TaxID=133901 RepID=A0A9C6X085_FRAOC|nr:uncharacterized protein LOC113204011 isoform X2 [Frankliniella occidentalis]